MSVATTPELAQPRAPVLQALIAEARRRARRRRVATVAVLVVATALLLFGTRDTSLAGSTQATTTATVIKTNWSERLDYSNGEGFLRLYVRRIELTRTGWKASVGVRNSSKIS